MTTAEKISRKIALEIVNGLGVCPDPIAGVLGEDNEEFDDLSWDFIRHPGLVTIRARTAEGVVVRYQVVVDVVREL